TTYIVLMSIYLSESYLLCVLLLWIRVLCFFFFQAEDGIRDLYVTGVQTCALPISSGTQTLRAVSPTGVLTTIMGLPGLAAQFNRSEERRVGKECRSRWSPEQ